VVAIDEAQFLDDQLPNVCETLSLRGIRVIVAGLDMDYLGESKILLGEKDDYEPRCRHCFFNVK